MPLVIIDFVFKNWKVVAAVAATIAIIGWFQWKQHTAFEAGQQIERQQIEDANHAAEQKADHGSKSVGDCADLGGVWDRSLGVCKSAAAGR